MYSTEWKSYLRSCSGNLKFLAELYQEGYSYGSLILYRFIISSVHEHIEGFPIGQHPQVSRILKGACNLRPPTP